MNPTTLNTPIESLDIFHIRVPLPEPLEVLGTFIAEREFVIARASAGGHVGAGFGFTRGAPLAQTARSLIAPLAVGKPLGSIRSIWTTARQGTRMTGDMGIFARALAVVDMALWDLLGQALNVPLWRLLGGTQTRIPCMAIAGYYRHDDSVGVVRREAELLMKQGYRMFKLHFGMHLDLDVQRMTALREVIGPDAMFCLDAGGAFNSIKQALDAWRVMERFNPAFLEDPFPASAWELVMRFAQTTGVKIAYGEAITSPQIIQALGGAEGIDIVRPDSTVLMGVTGYIQAIAPALENGVTIFPHYFPDVHASLAGAFGALMVEESPTDADTVGFFRLRAAQPDIRDGYWHLTERPGFGIEWDEDALKRYRVADR
jgi:L-alanine-DL-glutamate epimerase-like enolase superfamily enzyme